MKDFVMNFRIYFKFKLLSFLFTSLLLNGCLSVKPTSTKSGKNLFESFFVGEEGTQYFIKPVLFSIEETKEELVLDITFRYKNMIKDSAIVNFSIKGPMIYKNIDSLKISNTNLEINSSNIKLLFNEKTKNGFTSRFTTKIALNETKNLFNNDEWAFTTFNNSQLNKFKPAKKTQKAINILREKVFVLM
jgi:hypothetical protein